MSDVQPTGMEEPQPVKTVSAYEYRKEISEANHEGYYWLVLPSLPRPYSIGNLFGSGFHSGNAEDARVLVCERCELAVGSPGKHTEWHAKLDVLLGRDR